MFKRTDHYDGTISRYTLFSCRWFTVCLHVYRKKLTLPFHPHPWDNLTIRLWGSMVETTIENYLTLDPGKPRLRINPRFVFRKAEIAHKMSSPKANLITLFIYGRERFNLGGRA